MFPDWVFNFGVNQIKQSMKTLILTVICVLGSLAAMQAQDIHPSSVPSVVLNAFQQKYPKALGAEWEMEGDLYNVEFNILFQDHDAWFDNTGKLVKLVVDINQNDLPAAVKVALKQQFGGYKVDDIDRIDFNGTVTYKIDLEKGPEDRVVVFDAKGNVLENRLD